MASGANATTLTFKGLNTQVDSDTEHYDADVSRGALDCSLCEGLLSTQDSTDFPKGENVPDASTAGLFSSSLADLFDLANSSDASELAFVNDVLSGPDFTSGTKSASNPSTTFTSSAEYILFKIGEDPNYALIHNTVAGNTFSYTPISSQGSGLSHYVEFGSVSAVPLPAALSFMLTGLAGLGFLGWRKRTTYA